MTLSRFIPSIQDGLKEYLEEKTHNLTFVQKVRLCENVAMLNSIAKERGIEACFYANEDLQECKSRLINEHFRDLRERDMKRRAKVVAWRLGLHYYPALLCGLNVDPMAFVYAERVLFSINKSYWGDLTPGGDMLRGGWDSAGYYGVSPKDVQLCWYAAGCKNNNKFRLSIWGVWMGLGIPKKGMSLNQTLAWYRAKRWLRDNLLPQETYNGGRLSLSEAYSLTWRAVVALGKLSATARWAALQGIPPANPAPIKVRDLNWVKVSEVQKLKGWKKLQIAGVPPRTAWLALHGAAMYDSAMPSGITEYPWQGSVQNYVKICTELGGTNPWTTQADADMHRPAWELSKLFNFTECQQYCKKHSISIHDAGQFSLPSSASWTKKAWKDLAMKFGQEILRNASKWADMEKAIGGLPKSLVEFRMKLSLVSYEHASGNEAIAQAASVAGLSQHEFNRYVSWLKSKRLKNFESIPAPCAKSGVSRLHYDDPIAPLLGVITHCCQHPNGAAHDVARALVESPNMAAWVVFTPDGKIIQQAAVWRSGSMLVLDSIEGKRFPKDVEIWKSACQSVIGKLCINKVVVGQSYGATGLASEMSNGDTLHTYNCPASYSDATSAFVVCGGGAE